MAKRIYRELSDEVRKKISDSMIIYHKNQNIEDKRRINKKKSSSMQHYWSGIGNGPTTYTDDTENKQ